MSVCLEVTRNIADMQLLFILFIYVNVCSDIASTVRKGLVYCVVIWILTSVSFLLTNQLNVVMIIANNSFGALKEALKCV